MKRENGNLNFTLKDIDERRSYLLNGTSHNELISKKHKKTWKTLNYVQHLLFLASNFAGGVSIFAFASVIDVPCGSYKFCSWILNLCSIKKCKSINKKKKKTWWNSIFNKKYVK